MTEKLNDSARAVLDGPHVAMIATSNADGRPQSSIIFVKRDGDEVVFSTIKGRLKTHNMTRDPRVSLLVLDKAGMSKFAGPCRSPRTPRRHCSTRCTTDTWAAPRRRLSPAPSG